MKTTPVAELQLSSLRLLLSFILRVAVVAALAFVPCTAAAAAESENARDA